MWVCIAKVYLLPENLTFSFSKTTCEETETAFFAFESLSLVDECLVHHAAGDHEESFKRGSGIRGRENQGLICQLTPAASKMCSFKLKIRSRFLIVEIYTVIWQEIMKSVIFFFQTVVTHPVSPTVVFLQEGFGVHIWKTSLHTLW